MSTKRIFTLFLCLLIFVSLTSCSLLPDFSIETSNDTPLLKVHIIDVGQGDSILITTPENKAILIDGGNPKDGPTIVGYIKKQGIDTIDILIATHPHADHIGGLKDVIQEFEVKEILMPQVVHTSKTFENLLLTIDEKGLSITAAKGGLSYKLEDNLSLSILSPIKDYGNHLNNWSVVAQLVYKDKAFLFTGDAEYQAEKDILANYDNVSLKSHLLKVGHHGSKTSTSQEFLAAIDPDVAVISLGKDNSYGFPHSETMEKLQSKNIHIFRTDFHGTIVFFSDGKEIWTSTEPD